MKNMKISRKILTAFGVVIVAVLFAVGCALFGLSSALKSIDNFYQNYYTTSNAIQDMRHSLQSAGRFLGFAAASNDNPQQSLDYLSQAQAQLDALQDGVRSLEAMEGVDTTQLSRLADVGEELAGYQAEAVQFIQSKAQASDEELTEEEAAQLAADQEATSQQLVDSVAACLDSASTQVDALRAAVDTAAQGAYDGMHSSVMTSLIAMGALSAVGLVLTLIIAVRLVRDLVNPIREIEGVAERMAAGDFGTQVTYTSRDELGQMADAVRGFVETVGTIISDQDYMLGELGRGNLHVTSRARERYVGSFKQVLGSIERIRDQLNNVMVQINQSADQVSSGAQALSQGATEQASSVQELAATISEISTQINQNAENAQQASQMANQVGAELTRGNEKVQEMNAAMNQIREKSKEIGKIIKTIEDIAFQTNILALNAAVEAARAGQAGKGFAVVADEVRNLASKSAEASKSTSVLIEDSVAAVENGSRIAEETAKTILTVVEGAEEIVTTIDKIAQASQQQADAVVQVTQGMDQISSVVQTNSATAEQSAAASEELSGQANMLKELVGQFTLEDTGDSLGVDYHTSSYQPASDFSFDSDKY